MPTNINGFSVYGGIEARWLALGAQGGPVGLPLSNEAPTFDGVGRFQWFQNGVVSWHPEIGAHFIGGPIGGRWIELGAERFGYPLTDQTVAPDGAGQYNHLRAMHLPGRPESCIYWSAATGAHEVYGGIREKWAQGAWERGAMGYPIEGEKAAFDGVGRTQAFQHGAISWHPEIGAFSIQGAIHNRWRAIGAEKFGYPLTDEMVAPDGVGRYSHVRAMHIAGHPAGTIYWGPASGAHEVYGAIRDKWAALEWERGPLGYPTSGETATFDGVGRTQAFQGGVVSWHPEIGAFYTKGDICARWIELGAQRFGYPITDELVAPDGIGRYNHLRTMQLPGHPHSTIFWGPGTGAHEVVGGIRDRWAQTNWERGTLGYPLTNEMPTFDGIGRFQTFQGGRISWHPEIGAFFTGGSIGARWGELGAEQFGYPVTDELAAPDGVGRYNHLRAMHLPGHPESTIYWSQGTGAHEVYGAIRDRWAARGWERGHLGYPLDAERDRGDAPGREQRFQNGRIVWSPADGALCDPLVFNAEIATGGAAALGGSVTVRVFLDGSVNWQGHAHDSGADGYEYGISAVVRASNGVGVAMSHSGSVGGTFTAGSRDDDWNETFPASLPQAGPIRANLLGLNEGVLGTNLNYESDIGGFVEDVATFALKYVVGTVTGYAGLVIFLGVEVGSVIATGSFVPGARLLEGVLWMAGPANTLYALAAAGIARIGGNSRELTPEEYDWANAKVFVGALPPREKLRLTDTIGPGDRAFTFPTYDGLITLNMGEAGYDDPRKYSINYGRVFIHELTHACQIHHSSDLSLIAGAFANKVCEVTGDPYNYGPAPLDFKGQNLEQQAQITGDWFAGTRGAPGSNQTLVPIDEASPYFPYIVANVRTGDL